MLKETSAVLTGNEQYEGFGIDIIDELSKKLGFNYVFRIQADGVYGSLNKETNEFSGMLKEIIEGVSVSISEYSTLKIPRFSALT